MLFASTASRTRVFHTLKAERKKELRCVLTQDWGVMGFFFVTFSGYSLFVVVW